MALRKAVAAGIGAVLLGCEGTTGIFGDGYNGPVGGTVPPPVASVYGLIQTPSGAPAAQLLIWFGFSPPVSADGCPEQIVMGNSPGAVDSTGVYRVSFSASGCLMVFGLRDSTFLPLLEAPVYITYRSNEASGRLPDGPGNWHRTGGLPPAPMP